VSFDTELVEGGQLLAINVDPRIGEVTIMMMSRIRTTVNLQIVV